VKRTITIVLATALALLLPLTSANADRDSTPLPTPTAGPTSGSSTSPSPSAHPIPTSTREPVVEASAEPSVDEAPDIEAADVDVSVDENEVYDLSVSDFQSASIVPADGPRDESDNSFLYGDRTFAVDRAAIAVALLGFDPVDPEPGLLLSDGVDILDPLGNVAYIGFNYSVDGSTTGYVTVAAHTRVALSGPAATGSSLPANGGAIYLVDGTLWGVDADGFAHAADVVEAPADFSQRLATSSHRLLAQSRTAINTVEVDTMGQIDKLAAFLGRGDAPLVAGTVYAGQDRAGWGGISSPTSYLVSRYGGSWSSTGYSYLTMPGFTMASIQVKETTQYDNTCVPTAITRAFAYYRNEQGKTKIPASNYTLYGRVMDIAPSKGWSKDSGVFWGKIGGFISAVGDDTGYPNTTSKWILSATYAGTMKSAVNEDLAIIFSTQFGSYGNHAVNVAGWAEYKSLTTGKVSHMVAIWDGWKGTIRYIDWDAYMNDSQVIGGVNTVDVK